MGGGGNWSWLRTGPDGGHLWIRWWNFGFHKVWGISWLAAEPVSFSRRTLLHGVSVYLLTPWCRVILQKLTGLQLFKKFPAFHGTRRFITALTSVRQLSLSWASPIQSIYPHPTSCRSILLLSTHLRLGHPSGPLPSGFPKKTLYTTLSSPTTTSPFHSSRFYHPFNIVWAVQII